MLLGEFCLSLILYCLSGECFRAFTPPSYRCDQAARYGCLNWRSRIGTGLFASCLFVSSSPLFWSMSVFFLHSYTVIFGRFDLLWCWSVSLIGPRNLGNFYVSLLKAGLKMNSPRNGVCESFSLFWFEGGCELHRRCRTNFVELVICIRYGRHGHISMWQGSRCEQRTALVFPSLCSLLRTAWCTFFWSCLLSLLRFSRTAKIR